MKRYKTELELYAITKDCLDIEYQMDVVRKAIAGGITCLQFRIKRGDYAKKYALAKKLKKLCYENNVSFIINDDISLARDLNVKRIHLGQDDLLKVDMTSLIEEGFSVGVSVSSIEMAKQAYKKKADYLGVGAIFDTTSKDNIKRVSLEDLHMISNATPLDVVAIGGINLDNIDLFKNIDISGVAIISGIFDSNNITKQTENFKNKINKMKRIPWLPKVLSVAGNDGTGGAGLQADLKTMTAHNVFGMNIITSIPAQNTMGVQAIYEIDADFIKRQFDSVILDMRPIAIKIGMVSSTEIINSIVDKINEYYLNNIVLDPVMVTTTRHKLINDNAIEALKNVLIPLATIITPNIPEAEILANISIKCDDDMIKATKKIREYYSGAILLKGGHAKNECNDLLVIGNEYHWLKQKRIANNNVHGTGCTLSSAIASNLALGYDIETAVKKSKVYISECISKNLNLGFGSGPLQHF